MITNQVKTYALGLKNERGFKFKKKNRFYLNTWHGSAINWFGNTVAGRKDFNWDHIDQFCISGNYEAGVTCRDFNGKPEALLLSDLPRNDDLYNVTAEEINAIKNRWTAS